MNRKIFATAAAVAALLALSACGGQSPSTGAAAAPTPAAGANASADHNSADVTFAQSMIPHHQQAVEMAKLAPSRASNSEVKKLAAGIQEAQDPEIVQMQTFLRTWGATSNSGDMDSMPGMTAMPGTSSMPDMSSMPGMSDMPGMMGQKDMTALEKAKGAAFDRMFLTMMTEHHQGAITMAQTELTQGQNTEAKALAQKIIDDQQAEISEIAELLKTV